MRIMVLGSTGMLGHKACHVLSKQHIVYPISRRDGVDARNFPSVLDSLIRARPDAIVNCIGIVKSSATLSKSVTSIEVNSLFPHQLAELCWATNTRLLHVSTDCVFSGNKGNYNEDDIPDPQDWYGLTKLMGEVHTSGCLTIRTSFIGHNTGDRQGGLLEWFLSKRGGAVRGYINAIYTGFTTTALAHIIGDLLKNYPQMQGLYHVSSDPISKYDLLVKIRDAMMLNIEIIPSEQPYCDRSLDSTNWRKETRYNVPTWDEMIGVLNE